MTLLLNLTNAKFRPPSSLITKYMLLDFATGGFGQIILDALFTYKPYPNRRVLLERC